MLNGNPVSCQDIQMGEQQWQVQTLAFFLSEMHLETNGQKTAIHTDNAASVALGRIDLQTCTGNIELVSDAPFVPGATFRFAMGVPFEFNHLNPVTQPSPLNEPDMFWTWRNGYKFLRIDMRASNVKEQSTDSWAYHLGSVGCVSASAVRSPAQACAKPNLPRFEVTVPEGNELALVLHLDVLFADIVLTRANRCVMHGDTEPACDMLYSNVSDKKRPLFTMEKR